MPNEIIETIRSDYDRLAREYARHVSGELDYKPLDRQLLDRFSDQVRGKGKVCDLGCGPGHVARYLHQQGVPVFGLDLSPGMVNEARGLNPDIQFSEANMLALGGCPVPVSAQRKPSITPAMGLRPYIQR